MAWLLVLLTEFLLKNTHPKRLSDSRRKPTIMTPKTKNKLKKNALTINVS